MHPRVLKVLADVIVGSFCTIFKKSWQSWKVSDDCRKGKCHTSSKIARDYVVIMFTSVPRKVMEQIHLEVISKLVKDRKVIGTRQYGFTNSKSHLSNLIPFYDEVVGAMDKWRALDLLCLDFIRAFETVPHALITKLVSGVWISQW